MESKTEKYAIWTASIYKIITNTIRIIFGLLIFTFGCNSKKVIELLTSHELSQDPNGFFVNYFINHINTPPILITCSLSSALVLFSILDLIFIIAVLRRKYWGAVGFFIISLLWIPVEILFISRFLLTSKLIGFLINFAIILLFFKIISSKDKYFKN